MTRPEIESSLIDDIAFNSADKFKLLDEVNRSSDRNDLAILVAMRLSQDLWGEYRAIASDIVRSTGMFPYLSYDIELSLRNSMAVNYFRSPSRQDTIMHRAQASVLNLLLAGKSVILSAPTSFGKTFVVDELILTNKFTNVMIIVPTVALIEEIRRRVKSLGVDYNLISFTNQQIKSKNIFILTQERAHEMLSQIKETIGTLDILIIDEFYKMDKHLLRGEDKNQGDRADLLSLVYREYSSISKQVYLLGPYIQGVNGYDTPYHTPTLIQYDTNTTYLQIEKMTANKSKSRGDITRDLVESERENIMIYCSSPDQTRILYNTFLRDKLGLGFTNANDDLIEWIKVNICDNWYVIDALRHGIGIHHGRLPRFVSQEMIRRFSDGRIKILLCTSTIIEGVNTNARVVIIYNNSRAFNGGYLTFKNIAGRAGRMFKHFYGKVYCFEQPPKDENIEVNDPIGTESSETSPSLLSLLDDDQLSVKQRGEVDEHRHSSDIPLYLQKDNHFISLANQQKVLDYLKDNPVELKLLQQSTGPELLRSTIILIYRLVSQLGYSLKSQVHSGDDTKASIRAAIFTQAYFAGGIKELAKKIKPDNSVNDETIEQALLFMRNSMGYTLPKYVRAIDRLLMFAVGDDVQRLDAFANRLEFLNTEPVYMQLDELGVPSELSKRYQINPNSIEQAANDISKKMHLMSGFDSYVAQNFIDAY